MNNGGGGGYGGAHGEQVHDHHVIIARGCSCVYGSIAARNPMMRLYSERSDTDKQTTKPSLISRRKRKMGKTNWSHMIRKKVICFSSEFFRMKKNKKKNPHKTII